MIQQIASSPDGFSIGRGTIRAVADTLEVEMQGGVVLYDVTYDQKNYYPKINSKAVVFFSRHQAVVLFFDDLETIEISANNKISFNANNVQLPSLALNTQRIECSAPIVQTVAGVSLGVVCAQFFDALIAAQVATPAGVGTFAPATIASLNMIKSSLQNLINP